MRRVFISGIGAVTAYGLGAAALRDGLFSGASSIRAIRAFDASRLKLRSGKPVSSYGSKEPAPSDQVNETPESWTTI